jgi:HTH-type transcriptional regulator/antitoxin HigA
MKPKIIKTEADHQAALAYLETLMDAAPGSPEEEELELFSVLIEEYEKETFPIGLPDPIAAIQFRMEQQGLTRKDLIPYIGSQSKVSEVLSGKRPLSLSMIRALHLGLDIPAEILLREPGKRLDAPRYNWHDYPFSEMFKQGYFKSFNGALIEAKYYAEELLTELFSGFQGQIPEPVYCRSSADMPDECALAAWQARVLQLAAEQELPPYDSTRLTEELMLELVKLSKFEEGPRIARELLQKNGIAFVTLQHLPKTYLDGACFKSPTGRPIIGLTLRHDRLDNFWFTLVHELAHVRLHLGENNFAFFDETEGDAQQSCNPKEIEANTLAARLLIPEEIWNREGKTLNSKRGIAAFADRVGISPSIVAGRLRYQSQNYLNFDELLGRKAVRKLFVSANYPASAF